MCVVTFSFDYKMYLIAAIKYGVIVYIVAGRWFARFHYNLMRSQTHEIIIMIIGIIETRSV